MMTNKTPRLYAIGDLHLPGGADKPMHVFGSQWEGHFLKISTDWRRLVTDLDIVLIPGDISWAMQLPDAMADLQAIAELPGRKIIIRGNHDYWWSSIGKLRSMLPHGMYALQNDALLMDGFVFCGSRGWSLPVADASAEDIKIYRRELGRMEMSLQAAARIAPGVRPVVLTHFPPCDEQGTPTPMTRLLSAYGASDVLYGHVHGFAAMRAYAGELDGVLYHPTACDGLDFSLHNFVPAHRPTF